MNKFVIAFDGSRLDAAAQKHFELLLTNHKLLTGWSSPFRGLYFVTSDTDDAEQLSDSIDDFFDKKGLFIAKLQKGADNRNGRMPAAFWEFLKAEDNA